MNEGKIKNIEQIIDDITLIGYDHFNNINPDISMDNPKYSLVDLNFLIREFYQLVARFKENLKLLETLEHDTVVAIENNLNKTKNKFQSIKNRKTGSTPTPDQFNELLQNLIEFYRTIRQCGIYSILSPSVKIVEYEEVIDSIKGRSESLLKSAEESKKIIEDLIPNATASSMAAAIELRIKGLNYAVAAYLALFFVGTFILVCQSNKFLEMEKEAIKCQFVVIGFETWLKRLMYIVPAVYLILFAARQFSKERKLLEIYIHKRTIAQSLPAYMKQATDEKKDEVLLRGTTMIFSLPENPDTPLPGDGISLSDVKDMIKVGKP